MLRLILAPVFTLVGILLLSPLYAQDLYYWYNGQKIPLAKMKDHYIGRTSEDASRSKLSSLFEVKETNVVSYPENVFWLDKSDFNADQSIFQKGNTVSYFGNVLQNDQGATVAVIPKICVQLKTGGSIKEVLERFPNELTAVKDLGYNTYAIECTVQTPEAVLKLSNILNEEKLVEWSEPGFYSSHKPMLVPTDPLFNTQYYLRNVGQMGKNNGIDINIERGWDITTGSPIRVAVLDMGVEAHEDLAGRVMAGYTAGVTNGTGAPQNGNILMDRDKNHGMACAGIIGATHNNGIGIAGIAPNALIVPVNLFPLTSTATNPAGAASNIDIGNAIDWAWNQGAADVLSNSWGGGSVSYLIDAAILRARTQGRSLKGCPVVFASGNSATGGVFYPADLGFVITVGAINPGQAGSPLWWYSRFGPSMDLVAPSSEVNWAGDIRSLDRMNAAGGDPGNYVTNFGGTSAACPQVSGVAALMLSVNPNLAEVDVRTILQNTATDMGAAGFDNQTGFGRLDGCRAILQSLSINQLIGPTSFCTSQAYSLTNVSSTSLTWSVSGPAVITGSNHANPVTVTKTGNGTATLVATVDAGCGLRTFSKPIFVGNPVPTITILGIAPYPNTQMDFQVNTIAPAPYKWYVDNVLVNTAYSSTATINGGGCGYHNLKVEVTSSCGTGSATTQYNRSCSAFMATPNPAGDEITVSFIDQSSKNFKLNNNSEGRVKSIQLVSQLGEVKKTWKFTNLLNQVKLNISEMYPGSYFLKIESAGGVQTIPLIKK